MEKADSKEICGVTINTHHELDLDLIKEFGFPPQEPDPAVEAWKNNPVEKNLETIRKVSKHFTPMILEMAEQFSGEVRKR